MGGVQAHTKAAAQAAALQKDVQNRSNLLLNRDLGKKLFQAPASELLCNLAGP
jgi:hypothetical protein